MKMYEIKNEIGEATETSDGFIIRLIGENRTFFVAKDTLGISSTTKINDVPKKTYHAKAKYLRTKYDEKMGKALQTPLALRCYRTYGIRLFNNILRDIMSAINGFTGNSMSLKEYQFIYYTIFKKYGIEPTVSKFQAYSLFVREAGLVKINRANQRNAKYFVNHQPEIPKTE